MTIPAGVYTYGVGGTYPTLNGVSGVAAALAAMGAQAGDVEIRQVGACTDSAKSAEEISWDLDGNNLLISDPGHHQTIVNHDGYHIRVRNQGPGTITIDGHRLVRAQPTDSSRYACILLKDVVGTLPDLVTIQYNMIDGGGLKGTGIYLSESSALCHVHHNIVYNTTRMGFYLFQQLATSVIEHNIAHSILDADSLGYGWGFLCGSDDIYDVSGPTASILRNNVAIGCTTDYKDTSALTAFLANVSSDATGQITGKDVGDIMTNVSAEYGDADYMVPKALGVSGSLCGHGVNINGV